MGGIDVYTSGVGWWGVLHGPRGAGCWVEGLGGVVGAGCWLEGLGGVVGAGCWLEEGLGGVEGTIGAGWSDWNST